LRGNFFTRITERHPSGCRHTRNSICATELF
jgi:hypothetical protein